MGRSVLSWVCVCALGVVLPVACAEVVGGTPDAGGGGGGGGDGGSSGTGGAAGTGGTSVSCFPDADGDGYPAASEPMVFDGTCGEGYIEERDDSQQDCNDGSEAVRPNQEMFFDFALFPSGWDYNCDDVDERQYEVTTPFQCSTECIGFGWITSVPRCGASGNLVECLVVDGCAQRAASATQACR